MGQVIEIVVGIVCAIVGIFIIMCGLALYAANQEAKEQAMERMAEKALGNSKLEKKVRKRNSKGRYIKE